MRIDIFMQIYVLLCVRCYVVPVSAPIDIDQHIDKSLIFIISKWFPRVKGKYMILIELELSVK